MVPTGFNFVLLGEKHDSAASGLGGFVVKLTAGGNLNVGDVVGFTADNTVNKGTAIAGTIAGVVCGGARTYDKVVTSAASVGVTQAAANGESVLVLVSGIYFVITAAAYAAGVALIPDTTTAGRVLSTGAANVGQIGRVVVGSSGAGAVATALIGL